MAQSTALVNGVAATVSLKVASGSYVDISGSSMSVSAATATVATSDSYTLDGANAVILTGKFEPVDVTVNIYYTEVTSTEAFMLAQGAFAAKSTVQLKWVPKGAASGANTIETAASGYITSIDYPEVDASKPDALAVSFTIRCPGITYTDVA